MNMPGGERFFGSQPSLDFGPRGLPETQKQVTKETSRPEAQSQEIMVNGQRLQGQEAQDYLLAKEIESRSGPEVAAAALMRLREARRESPVYAHTRPQQPVWERAAPAAPRTGVRSTIKPAPIGFTGNVDGADLSANGVRAVVRQQWHR
jgi:hypothetical protein